MSIYRMEDDFPALLASPALFRGGEKYFLAAFLQTVLRWGSGAASVFGRYWCVWSVRWLYCHAEKQRER